MKPNYSLWHERFSLPSLQLTDAVIFALQRETDAEKRRQFSSLLFFLYADGVAAEQQVEPMAKAEIIKQGETALLTADRQRLVTEIAHSLSMFGEESVIADTDIRQFESYRVAALLLQTPFDNGVAEAMINTVEKLTRIKELDADASYILISAIYQKLNDPVYSRFFATVESDFWERVASSALKVMSQFLYAATMEYIIYYELPPGGHNDYHLKRCEKLIDVTVDCCHLVHRLSAYVRDLVDQQIYGFCTDVIVNQKPQQLITYSYRLLDPSSEDFFITLPKEQINGFIKDSIQRLVAA